MLVETPGALQSSCDLCPSYMQSFAFNGNPLLETADYDAPASFSNVGTSSGLALASASGSIVTVAMSAAASAAINCTREIQFRMGVYNQSNGFPFTNFDDSYVQMCSSLCSGSVRLASSPSPSCWLQMHLSAFDRVRVRVRVQT